MTEHVTRWEPISLVSFQIREKKEIESINHRIDIALSEIDECKKMYSQVISTKQIEELDSVTHSLRLCRSDSIESKFVYNRLIEAETSFHSIKKKSRKLYLLQEKMVVKN